MASRMVSSLPLMTWLMLSIKHFRFSNMLAQMLSVETALGILNALIY